MRLSKNKDLDDLLEEIKNDTTHGADYISNLALKVMIHLASKEYSESDDLMRDIRFYAREIIELRPSMSPLTSKIIELMHRIDPGLSLDEVRSQVKASARIIIRGSDDRLERIVKNLHSETGDIDSVFTHSRSSTVLGVIQGLGAKKCLCTESRPLFEGREMAKMLRDRGVDVTLIVDSAIGMFIDSAELALSGADSVLADGSVVNKVGTKVLALSALDAGVPFYTVCDTYKFNLLNYLGKDIELEEHDPEEVADIEGINVRNPYFEVIPSSLIKGVITENGLMTPSTIKDHMSEKIKNVESLLDYGS
jgi:eIF-2B alpha/beta/delta-like uncharacterized protein